MKNSAIFALMGAAMVITSGTAVAGTATDSTTVTFTGAITETPCSLDAASDKQEVPLGHIAAHSLENNGQSPSQQFQFQLKDCDVSTMSHVSVTFTGTPDSHDSSLLALGGGAASGAGIAIAYGDSQVKLGEATAKQALVDGSNTLQFAAYLKGDGASAITPGDFTSISNVTFTYQ